ncbi:MAG: AAA family ATPase [Culicoidibacterales bacterium]
MLIFKKIQFKNVYDSSFEAFENNNVIKFRANIAVLYGPNGTGKSTLTNLFTNYTKVTDQLELEFKFKKNSPSKFHVIHDQSSRNIIQGDVSDYLLGDNIYREYELKSILEEKNIVLLENLKTGLKEYGIAVKSHLLFEHDAHKQHKLILQEVVNSKIDKKKFLAELTDSYIELYKGFQIQVINQTEEEREQFKYIGSHYKSATSILAKILKLTGTIQQQTAIHKLGEHEKAIGILEEFPNHHECIVCDNTNYHPKQLKEKKEEATKTIISQLDAQNKQLIEKIIPEVANDPFDIKVACLKAIETGSFLPIEQLQHKINQQIVAFNQVITQLLANKLLEMENFVAEYQEYKTLTATDFIPDDKDQKMLCNIISELVGKKLTFERNDDKTIAIKLAEQHLLENDSLFLSTGQKNFISLTFEMLRAKKINQDNDHIIVIDDPISSFDSIFKNKIMFCLNHFLGEQKIIVLTHNTDTVKLINFQTGNLELYLFNNTPGQENGFIPINKNEVKYFLNMYELIKEIQTLSTKDVDIIDRELFLLSLVPFMRGYANICLESESYQELSEIMHGYGTQVVNVAAVFNQLFLKNQVVEPLEEYLVSVESIIDKIQVFREKESKQIIANRPLLNKTLIHSMNYLFIRLSVEQTLVNSYTPEQDEKFQVLEHATTSQIIDIAFPRGHESRIFFMSKKTLLNEFNHYEGSLNLFEPAIDITDAALNTEVTDILAKLRPIKC